MQSRAGTFTGTFTCESPKVERAQVSFNRVKLGYSLLSSERKGKIDTHNNLDGSPGNYAKGKRSQSPKVASYVIPFLEHFIYY